MTDEDKELLEHAFAAALVGAKHALSRGWRDAHLLVRASTPNTTFDPTNEKEKAWWTKQLTNFAQDLAALPIVDCTAQLLPATSPGGPCAHFVIPRLLPTSTADETTVERLWPLVEACTELMPPRKELALDWTGIASGWHSLGLDISRITVSSLAKKIRGNAGKLDALNLKDSKTEWLAKFLDIVGECWTKRSGVELSVLTDLMPDQNRDLRPPSALHRDVGVTDALKDICRLIGHDVRGKLLLSDVEEMAAGKNLQYLPVALKQAFPKSLSEDQVVEEAVKHLDNGLPEDDKCDQTTESLQRGAVLLLDHLWKSRGKNAAAAAEKVPLLTSNGHAVRWSHNRMMMAPMRSWHKAAQPFAAAYPPDRVLADFFGRKTGDRACLAEALRPSRRSSSPPSL
jgi:hypothetical protein